MDIPWCRGVLIGGWEDILPQVPLIGGVTWTESMPVTTSTFQTFSQQSPKSNAHCDNGNPRVRAECLCGYSSGGGEQGSRGRDMEKVFQSNRSQQVEIFIRPLRPLQSYTTYLSLLLHCQTRAWARFPGKDFIDTPPIGSNGESVMQTPSPANCLQK